MTNQDYTKFKIEKQDVESAKAISVLLDNEVDRKRAFASAVSLKAFQRYLAQIHLQVDAQSGLYQVPKFFQEFDLADLYYKNINIDVRVLYSDEDVFVPKKHFEYSIQPDIYVVAKLDAHLLNLEILGYFESRQMSKARSEKFYYLNSIENLKPIEELTNSLETITPINRTSYDFNHERTIEQFLAYLDKEISSTNKLKMVRHLVYCPSCRKNLVDLSLFDFKMHYLNQYQGVKEDFLQSYEESKLPQGPMPEIDNFEAQFDEVTLGGEDEDDFDLDSLSQDFDISDFQEAFGEPEKPTITALSDNIIQTSQNHEILELEDSDDSLYDNILPEQTDFEEDTTVQAVHQPQQAEQKYPDHEVFDDKLKDILELNSPLGEFHIPDLDALEIEEDEVDELKKDLLIEEDIFNEKDSDSNNEFLEQPTQEESQSEDDSDISVLYQAKGPQEDIIPDVEVSQLEKQYRVKKPETDLKKYVLISALVLGLLGGSGYLLYSKNFSQPPKTVELTPNTEIPDENNSLPAIEENLAPGELPKLNADMSGPKDINKAMTDVFSSDASAVTITKISWEVPEDLAKAEVFKKYLQIAGKNLQLNLQNDLLNTSDFAYNDKVKVFLQIDKDNKIKGIKITESSGSEQIDAIVLQSIKDTLKYINLPVVNSKSSIFELTLLINF